jgi:CheY-like chemotaxis protein/DNA-binding CsgD family transcriptional regulator
MSKYHIQVVDDDPVAVLLMTVLLEKGIDCKVSVANDGREAVLQAKELLPNLILMDWIMPNLDGIEAVKLLKDDILTAIIPVIFVTCISDKDALIKAYDAGVTDFINKPIQEEDLLVRVKSALKMSDIQRENLDAVRKEMLAQSLKNVYYDGLQSKFLNTLKEYKGSVLTDSVKAESQLKEIIHELEANTKDKTWDRLENIVQETDPEFLRKLGDKHQQLTRTEIKLCYLLRLNMSTKDISNLTFQTQESVHQARMRLRKKLNLSSEDNLSGYLLSL